MSDPIIKFPKGTPIEQVMETIELVAKGTLGNDQKIVDLIKEVSKGAQRSDDLLLEAVDTLAKSIAGLIKEQKRLTDMVNGSVELIKSLNDRILMLESKDRIH